MICRTFFFFKFLLDILLQVLNHNKSLLSYSVLHNAKKSLYSWHVSLMPTTKPHCCNTCRMCLGIVLLKYAWVSWKRHCLDGSNGALTDVSHAGTNTCWLLKLALVTIWMVLFLFRPEDTTAMISKNNLDCGLIRSFLDVGDTWVSLCMAES